MSVRFSVRISLFLQLLLVACVSFPMAHGDFLLHRNHLLKITQEAVQEQYALILHAMSNRRLSQIAALLSDIKKNVERSETKVARVSSAIEVTQRLVQQYYALCEESECAEVKHFHETLSRACIERLAALYTVASVHEFLAMLEKIDDDITYWGLQNQSYVRYISEQPPRNWCLPWRRQYRVERNRSRLLLVRRICCEQLGIALEKMRLIDERLQNGTHDVMPLQDAWDDLRAHNEQSRLLLIYAHHQLKCYGKPFYVMRHWGAGAVCVGAFMLIGKSVMRGVNEMVSQRSFFLSNAFKRFKSGIIDPFTALKEAWFPSSAQDHAQKNGAQEEFRQRKERFAQDVIDFCIATQGALSPKEQQAIKERIMAGDFSKDLIGDSSIKQLDTRSIVTRVRGVAQSVYNSGEYVRLFRESLALWAVHKKHELIPSVQQRMHDNKFALSLGPALPLGVILGAGGLVCKMVSSDNKGEYADLCLFLKEYLDLLCHNDQEVHYALGARVQRAHALCKRADNVPLFYRTFFKRDIQALIQEQDPLRAKEMIQTFFLCYPFLHIAQ